MMATQSQNVIGEKGSSHIAAGLTDAVVTGLAEVDRLLMQLEKNLNEAKLSLKRKCCAIRTSYDSIELTLQQSKQIFFAE